MRGAIAILALSVTGLMASPAFARDVKISGTHSVSDIEIHCIDNGGTFFNGPHGGYGCAGSGGGTVTCTNKGKCTGTVSRVVGKGGKGSGISGVVNALNHSKSGGDTHHPIQTGVNTSKPSSASSSVGGGQNGGMQHHGGRGH